MRPSNSLIALGMGTVLAASAAASVPVQAAPIASPQSTRSADTHTHEQLASSEAASANAIAQNEPEPTPEPALENEPEPTPEPALENEPEPEPTPESAPENEAEPSPEPEPAEVPPSAETSPQDSPSETAAPETVSPEIPTSETTPTATTTNEPAPEYLNPDPNPLSFPTTPEEVQIVGTQPITLKQAIELAIRNSRSLQQSRLELERAQASLRQAEAANLPTLGVVGNVTFNAQENATSPLSTTGDTEFDVTTSDSTTLNGTVEANYNLFTAGQRSSAIAAARGQARFQQLQVEADTEQLILDVTNNYYDLQQADEQVRITQASLTEAQRSLRDAQALERAGVGTRFDVLQSEVDVANAQQDLTQQISQQEIARRQIVQQLSLSQAVDITAADPIEVAGLWDLNLEDTIVLSFKNRAELEQQLVQREISKRNRRQALAQLEPQVNLRTTYGLRRTLDSSTSPFFEGFLSTFTAAVGVTWDIFDGGSARAQADQQEANIAIAENQFASNREQIRFLVEQAYSTLRSSFDNIQVTSRAVVLATESLRLARLRFQAGVGTQSDVLQQQTALTQAEVNRLTAILNYNRALASLRRQVSNYPDGALAETP
ncbi:MAG: TolC family protein [Leptolyngbyaceae cyanobacterium CRU_2_3]|nr:TolC family protein [Leptolyngbyaceae cyanobacterium CRU_2_3]